MATAITVLDRLLEIGGLFQKDMARAFSGTPLTPARTRVLWDLAHSGPSTQHALAARLEVSPRNITGLVDALEVGGYVTRSPHPTDRRAIIVSLTASAEQLMHEMQREHAELTADLLAASACWVDGPECASSQSTRVRAGVSGVPLNARAMSFWNSSPISSSRSSTVIAGAIS